MQLGECFWLLKKTAILHRGHLYFVPSYRSFFRLHLLIVLTYLLGVIGLSAQAPPNISKFHHLTREAGLSDDYNAFVSRDSFGFTWISSTDGLNRFDGNAIKVYGRDQLGHSVVTSYCFQDSTGDLWFTSYNAINHYIRAEDRFEQIYLSKDGMKAKEDYYAFHLSASGELWIRLGVGEQGRLYNYNIYTGKQETQQSINFYGTRIKASDGPTGTLRWTLSTYLPGKPGIVFTFRTEDQNFEQLQTVPTNADGLDLPTYNAWIESDSVIWVGTKEGVAQLTYQNGVIDWPRRFNTLANGKIGLVRDVVGYGDDLLLLATKDQGLVLLNKKSGQVVGQYLADSTNDNSLQSNGLRELMLDHEANLWISAYGLGVDYCNLQKLKFNSLSTSSVTSILPKGDDVYLGTGNGAVLRLNAEQQLVRTISYPNDSQQPVLLYGDVPGKFWAASGRHLALFNESTATWEQKISLASRIKSLLKLKNGKCIVSTEQAYYEIKIVGQRPEVVPFQDLTAYNGSPSTFMFEDHRERIYLAKNASSLLVFENQDQGLKLEREIQDVGYVFGAVTIPGEDGIWLSGSFGLAHLKEDSLHVQAQDEESYRSTSFYGILHSNDKIWLSGNTGLYTFDLRTKEYRAYQETDGLQREAFSQTAFATDVKGTFYFGNENGITYFDPEKVRDISTAPKVQLLELWAQDKLYYKADSTQIRDGDFIVLKPRDNTFKLVFVGMEYSDPSFITYRVKLDGVDPDWVERGQLNEIRYPSVAPGTHTFRIIARNPDGIESKPFELYINVKPFYYQTMWFKVAVALLLLLLAFGIYQDQLRRRLRKETVKNLEALNAYKSRFFTNITHEFRSPLNIILSYLDTALQKNKDLKKGNLEIMQRSGKQLLHLVNQILDLRRLEVAKLQVHYEELDVFQLANAVVVDFQKLAYGKGIELELRSELAELLTSSDREKLRKILSNLVSNAIKFTSRGGQVNVQLAQQDEDIVFQVIDTGIGISKDKLPHIFEQFYQAHDENTNKFGSGVGLALSQELAQAMGGEISVESKVGIGSTFTLTLPVVPITTDDVDSIDVADTPTFTAETNVVAVDPEKDTQALAEQLYREAIEGREEKPLLLIVEDNPNFRQYIEETLSPHYRTVIRNNGEDGLATAKKLVPDLVVTDVKMPIMDGYELTSALKLHDATCHIPIILLTGLEDIDARVKGIQKGADIYLNKPFHEQELLSWIENLLRLRVKLQSFYRGLGFSASDESQEQLQASDPDREFIQKVRTAIDENFHKESFSVKELSKMVNMEYVTFYRKFRAITNENAKKTIQDKRIARARYLLLNEPSKRIRQIAFEVGFSDPGYFSKAFKEIEGVTPKKFRDQNASKQ